MSQSTAPRLRFATPTPLPLVATLDAGLFAPTVELKVNYLRPATVGRLIGSGRVVHRGRNVAFLAGELRDADGRLLATATATTQIQPMR